MFAYQGQCCCCSLRATLWLLVLFSVLVLSTHLAYVVGLSNHPTAKKLPNNFTERFLLIPSAKVFWLVSIIFIVTLIITLIIPGQLSEVYKRHKELKKSDERKVLVDKQRSFIGIKFLLSILCFILFLGVIGSFTYWGYTYLSEIMIVKKNPAHYLLGVPENPRRGVKGEEDYSKMSIVFAHNIGLAHLPFPVEHLYRVGGFLPFRLVLCGIGVVYVIFILPFIAWIGVVKAGGDGSEKIPGDYICEYYTQSYAKRMNMDIGNVDIEDGDSY